MGKQIRGGQVSHGNINYSSLMLAQTINSQDNIYLYYGITTWLLCSLVWVLIAFCDQCFYSSKNVNSSLGKSSKPSALHLDGLHLMQVKQIQCHCRRILISGSVFWVVVEHVETPYIILWWRMLTVNYLDLIAQY